MDAISSPVSSLRATVAGGCASTTTTATFLAPHHHQTHLLKPSCHRLSLLSTTKPQSIPSSSRSHHHHTKSLHLSSESHSPFSTSRTAVHQKPSTGYAAALLDSARCGGHKLLLSVDQDVRRFTQVFNKMMAAGFVGGEAVREAAESGGFDKRLVALVRMLLGKGRVEMVGEVMKEFGRICDELSGTRVVVVAAEKRMAEKELAGIAREVQRTTGAAKVRVRHVFGERLPRSFLSTTSNNLQSQPSMSTDNCEGSSAGVLGARLRGKGKDIDSFDLPASPAQNSIHNRRRAMLIQEGENIRSRCKPGDKIPKRKGQEMPMKTEVQCAKACARIQAENNLLCMRFVRKQWVIEQDYWALTKVKLAKLVENMGWVTPEGISDESGNEKETGYSPIISDESDDE